MSSSEDGISQSSKKRKHNSNRRRILRFFRFPYCNTKSQYKHDELETKAGDSSTEAIPSNLSMFGDLASLGNSSRGDAVTIGSVPSENAVLGATCAVSDSKSLGKQDSTSSGDPTFIECPLCLNLQSVDNFPRLMTCPHRSCIDCLRQYLMIEITESRVNVTCPECQEKIHPVDMQLILKNSPQLIEKWEEFTLRRCLSVDPDCRWCPAPDCGFAVIAHGCASCPKIHCDRPGCNTDFCYHCRQEWHPDQTCDSAHLQRTKQLRLRSNSTAYSQGPAANDQIKPCPKCGALIAKMNDGSCNHMTCTVCEAEFCWLCLQEITDLHYLSPSGCTFWGKKPWSRKKKILWQLGLLIGAPLGIGLVAGVAVPAIVIGLPIWVARRVMAQFANRSESKHKRNSAVAACVMLSIVVSPLLAALAVGIGVPIMLLYVYGVVPFSLCRTGSYGLAARNAAGRARTAMRIELGSPVVPTASGGQASYDTSSLPGPTIVTGIRQTITNPSIGEASVGGLTMASLTESHVSAADRIDGDGASTTAIAGASITGSITGSMAATTVDAANNKLKENENTSSGPNSAVTSVQIHMQDNVSVHSTSSYAPSTGSTISKSYSSKSLGAKRKSKGKGKMTKISGKSSMPRKISEQEETKTSMTSSSVTFIKPVQTSSTDSSPDSNSANLTLAAELKGKPVIVEIEKSENSSVLKVHTEDSASTSSVASSCGSQNALLDQPSSTTQAKTSSNAAAVVKRDSITITDESSGSKRTRKNNKQSNK
ncbi:E3 ubiquitin-protein ligase RNF19A-like [Styela clava]